jgi:hypothetical protein
VKTLLSILFSLKIFMVVSPLYIIKYFNII